MKIIAILAAAVLAEKKKPDFITPQKRLDTLNGWYQDCVKHDFFTSHRNGDNLIARLNRKFEKLNEYAEKYMKKYPVKNGEIADDEQEEDTRINKDDPCSCVAGTAHGFRRFYTRLQEINGKEKHSKHKGNRKWEATKIHSKVVNKILNDKYQCDIKPQKVWELATKWD